MSMIVRAIEMGLAQKPDVICVTGDFITSKSGFDENEYAIVLRRLSKAAPTFAVLGNHDGLRDGRFGELSITRWWNEFWSEAGSRFCIIAPNVFG